MRRPWVFGLTMYIASCVTTDTSQQPSQVSLITPIPSATSELPPSPPPVTTSTPETAALVLPEAAALAGAGAAGITYAAGRPPPPGSLPGPAGSERGDIVLLATPRASAPPAKGHTDSPAMLNYIYDARSSAHKHMHHSQRFGPLFETNTTSITVQIGSSAALDCKISLLQDNAVSWVLKSSEDSLRLLTVGQMTYSGDARHSVEFLYPNNWRLTVRNVTKQDEGVYECQISTHPPRLIRTHLFVNVPEVLIVDENGRPIQDKHYETSSTIRLSCIVRHVYMTGSVVSWIHSGVLLNQDSTRGGISVKSELREDGAESVLSVARVDKADSGNYTCSISASQRTTVLVHVLDGESMAELHLGSWAVRLRPHLQLLQLLLLAAALGVFR